MQIYNMLMNSRYCTFLIFFMIDMVVMVTYIAMATNQISPDLTMYATMAYGCWCYVKVYHTDVFTYTLWILFHDGFGWLPW
jgi:hypothetical protein